MPPATPRPISISLALIFATILAGLAVRFARLGLPAFVVKYGGSTLWALMLYWIVSALLPAWKPRLAALLTGILATAVELFKLYHSPAINAFRHTIPGILLLGRIFSMWDIVAYWLAILIGASIDSRLCRATISSRQPVRRDRMHRPHIE